MKTMQNIKYKVKILSLFFAILIMCSIFIACDTVLPSINIIGDVHTIRTISDMHDAEKNDGITSYKVSDLFSGLGTFGAQSDVFIVAHDGLASSISLRNTDKIYLSYSKDNKWEITTTLAPPSICIKDIKEIVVRHNIDNNINSAYDILSAGEILTQNYSFISESSKNDINVRKYNVTSTAILMPQSTVYTLFCNDGSQIQTDFYEPLVSSKGVMYQEKIIQGIGIGNISQNISRVYNDVLELKNEKLMIIEIDGLGYEQYIRFNNIELIPFLSNYEPIPTYSMYPSISNVGLASIITGTTPDVHGVAKRGDRELKVPTLFDMFSSKSIAYLEGNSSLINTSITPILAADVDGKNHTDNEVYKNALAHIDTADFMYVHFHGLDDTYSYDSAYSKTSRLSLMNIATYIEDIATKWDGSIIITSDHGGHNSVEYDLDGNLVTYGKHGSVSYQDMVVPYFIIKWSNQ